MKPLGYTLEEMSAVMRDIEALRAGATGEQRADVLGRLAALRADAAERRARLERQLGMADEFLGILAAETGEGSAATEG